jgi:hypothetical protein
VTDQVKTPPAAGTAGRGNIDLVAPNQNQTIGAAQGPQAALEIRWRIHTELHNGRKRLRATLGKTLVGHCSERGGGCAQ